MRRRTSDDGRIAWRQADALALPFEDGAFDVVACQFGVLFFPDKVQGYREARRVPSRAAVSSSTSGTGSRQMSLPTSSPRPWRQCFRTTRRASWRASRTAIMTSTRCARNSPQQALLRFRRRLRPDSVPGTSAHGAAIAYCQGTPLSEIETRDASRLEEATQCAAEWLARRFGGGPIEGLIQAHVFEAASADRQRVPARAEGTGSGGPQMRRT